MNVVVWARSGACGIKSPVEDTWVIPEWTYPARLCHGKTQAETCGVARQTLHAWNVRVVLQDVFDARGPRSLQGAMVVCHSSGRCAFRSHLCRALLLAAAALAIRGAMVCLLRAAIQVVEAGVDASVCPKVLLLLSGWGWT
eukprot:15476335-Alexandrium_andersonii.AAC.1